MRLRDQLSKRTNCDKIEFLKYLGLCLKTPQEMMRDKEDLDTIKTMDQVGLKKSGVIDVYVETVLSDESSPNYSKMEQVASTSQGCPPRSVSETAPSGPVSTAPSDSYKVEECVPYRVVPYERPRSLPSAYRRRRLTQERYERYNCFR